MKTLLLALPVLLLASPALATGGYTCRTGGAKPVTVSVGFGHVPGSPLIREATRLVADGRNVPVIAPQWWLDHNELRLLLADPAALRREAIIKARRNGSTYDGSIWRGGKRRWIRCRES
jgi:hypothetical protein